MIAFTASTETDAAAPSSQIWLPTCATPDRLWNVYANQAPWQLVSTFRAPSLTNTLRPR